MLVVDEDHNDDDDDGLNADDSGDAVDTAGVDADNDADTGVVLTVTGATFGWILRLSWKIISFL